MKELHTSKGYDPVFVSLLAIGRLHWRSGARFSKAPENFRARKAILRSSVSKNEEVYTPETSCMKETSLHL